MKDTKFLSIEAASVHLFQRGIPLKPSAIRSGIKAGRLPYYRLNPEGRNTLIPIDLLLDTLSGKQVDESWFRGVPPALANLMYIGK